MHHKPRYPKSIAMRVYFYGGDIGEQERALARGWSTPTPSTCTRL
jgi:hypothetical protein